MSLCVGDRFVCRSERNIYQRLYWYNWFYWWWVRGCSKHVENWNKYIGKNCASSCSFTVNHDKMHSQQNIEFCGWDLFTLGFAQVMPAVIPCDKLLESTNCYLLHCAHHWSLCGCSSFSMVCAVSSFHTDDGVATPNGSFDCVCNYLYYLTLRMYNLLHPTVLQAIFAKLVISC